MIAVVPGNYLVGATAQNTMFTKLNGNAIVTLPVEIPKTQTNKLILLIETQSLCNPENKRLYVQLFLEDSSRKYDLGNFSFFGDEINRDRQVFVFSLKELEQIALRQGAKIKATVKSFDAEDTNLSSVNLELNAKIELR